MSVPPKKMGLSLYADLLDPNKGKSQGATISGAPVKYDLNKANAQEEAAKKKDASLQFQPIRRPQVQAKPKSKPSTSSSSTMHRLSASTSTLPVTASSPNQQLSTSTLPGHQQPSVQKSTISDWAGDEDEEYYFERPRHERGGRKKKKKNKQDTRIWDWDDIYDPSLPNNYADYKGSDEQYREIRDWKARLYYHQLKNAQSPSRPVPAYSDEEEEPERRPMNKMFAPPASLSFAPPSFDEPSIRPQQIDDDDDDYQYPTSTYDRQEDGRPAFATATLPDDNTGEDAYMRRMRLSGMAPQQTSASPAPPAAPTQAPTQSAPETPAAQSIAVKAAADIAAKKAEAQAKLAAIKARLDAAGPKAQPQPPAAISPNPPVATAATSAVNHPIVERVPPPTPPAETQPGASISRAPVRYELPSAPANIPSDRDVDTMMDAEEQTPTQPVEAEEKPRSNRPGQKGFAERLLQKYGWQKGQGLGAQGEGITTAIIAKAEKRKKRSDAQGGGWAQPKNMGKLVGGKRRKVENTDDDDGKHGQMSEVVKLEGMLAGLDVEHEIQENNLMQEIGDEFGEKYGTVERLFIWRAEMGGNDEVFVKFTSQLSALRAVNATDGMTFADNNVVARFYDSDRFERGEYGQVG